MDENQEYTAPESGSEPIPQDAPVTDEAPITQDAPVTDETPSTPKPEMASSCDYVVMASGLTKLYGGFVALNGLNITIPRGRIIGLLGPNGSGKTTFIKILAGLLTRDAGAVTICGYEPGIQTKSLVSYLPERTYLSSWKSVRECLDYFQDFYADFDREKAEKMLTDLSIDINAKMRTLSKGTKEKVQLILVMARRAQLYLLDEPIAGVDPAAREYIIETIIKHHNEGATVIISTHLIMDVEKALDDYLFIYNGQIFEAGNAKTILQDKGKTLDAHFREVFRYAW